MKFATDNYVLLKQMYVDDKKSLREIASSLGTNATKILRALKFLEIPLRTKSEAQLAALDEGKSVSPTKGKTRPDDVKLKIGEKVSESWSDKSEEELKLIKAGASERWKNMTEEQRENLKTAAYKALRKVAKEGSALENAILDGLAANGYNVLHHYIPVEKTTLEVDIFIPELLVAIEIDGPSHFLPIWGNDSLTKTIQSDNEKNGLLALNGICVLRVECPFKSFSQTQARNTLNAILEQLDYIKSTNLSKSQKIIKIRME